MAGKSSPKRSVAVQALGYVEEKLRRVFNLAGPIGVTLEPEVKPVIVVDDLRDPGHAFYQGRSWICQLYTNAGGTGGTGAGKQVAPFHFLDDVIVEGAFVFGQLGTGFVSDQWLMLYQVTPEQWGDGGSGHSIVTGGANVAAWRDRLTKVADSPPIEAATAWQGFVGLPNPVTEIFRLPGGFVPVPAIFPIKIFVPRGGALNWLANNDIGPLTVGLYGRVFPQ